MAILRLSTCQPDTLTSSEMQPVPTVQVVCAVILHDGRVLATRRDPKRHYPLLWEFPGGKIEPEESPEAAFQRELLEELDLAVAAMQPLEPVSHSDAEVSIKLIPFACRPSQVKGPIPLDHTELRWISPDEALQLTWAPADIPLVENLQSIIDTYENE